ncbi:uncharacterized protein [Rutidosis leptorrhynchoides]|uniref:uncharacterized protein n=1 Tax=Rutidosis leptorrhynchoides TaxID=125765 RepID=UPI003A99F2E5
MNTLNNIETLQHVFFECCVAAELWRRIRLWLDIPLPMFADWSEVMSWYDGWHANAASNIKVYVVFASLLWHIWRLRNSVVFPGETLKKSFLFDSICNFSFLWLSSRGKVDVNWNEWLIKPV